MLTGLNKIESLKKEIIDIVDNNWNPWIKAAFYSDPEVDAILRQLYEEWEKAGRVGIPLDYATLEQLEILYYKAQEYRDVDMATVTRELIMEEKTLSIAKPRSLKDKILTILKRLCLIPGA